MSGHYLIDQRSLAFGHAIVQELQHRPELIERAKATLENWLVESSPQSRTTLNEWSAILSGPGDDVIAILTGSDQRSVRLRQSNPFAGVLSPAERNSIIRRFRNHDAAPA